MSGEIIKKLKEDMGENPQTREEYYQSLEDSERENHLLVRGKNSEPKPVYTQEVREQIKTGHCDSQLLPYIAALEAIARAAVNYYRDGSISDSRTLREALERVDWMQDELGVPTLPESAQLPEDASRGACPELDLYEQHRKMEGSSTEILCELDGEWQ